MLRRLRRAPLLLVPALLLGSLTACGDDSGSGAALDAVSVDGSAGEAPKVDWPKDFSADEVQTKTLDEGDGAELQKGDSVFTNIWIGDGFDQSTKFNTYDTKQPQLLKLDENTTPVFVDALEGAKLGSRVAVAAPADKAFGDTGNPQLGIGNKDSLLIILDPVSTLADGPSGTEKKAPSWAPGLETKGEDVTGLDFSGTPKPDGKLRSAPLIQGDGATVKKGQSITVNYLGQVYGGKKPFDESYSKDATSFRIGVGAVVPGWDKTLVGAKVGSRMILAIPPKEGYGKQGSPQAGIKGTDTLYFVVDILGAN